MPWVVLSAAALVAPLCWPIVTGRVFTGPDLPNFNLPIRFLYSEALRAGDSMLWTPSLFSGFFIFGEGQAGMAHPFHLLLYRIAPLWLAFGLEILTSYVVALAGARVLFGRLGFSPAGAWLGAIVFAFSGFNLLHISHMNAVAIVAHVPWVLAATHALMTSVEPRTRGWAFAAIALLLGSQILLGYPHYLWMTVLATGAFVVGLLWTGAPLTRAVFVVLAVVAGVLVGAVQLVATWDMLHTSIRADPSLAVRLTGSLSPWNLLQLWSPFVFAHRIYASAEEFLVHEFGLYNGAFCTLSLAWVAVRWRSLERRRLVVALLIFGAFSLVLALGRYGGLYPLLAELPGLNTLRVPARHIMLVHLTFAALAAVVFDDLAGLARRGEQVPWRRLWPLAAVAMLSVVTSVAGAVLAGSPWAAARFMMLSGIGRAGFGSALVLTAAALLTCSARGVRGALAALALFVAADLGAWGYGYVFQTPLVTIDAVRASANLPRDVRSGEYVFPPTNFFEANLGVLRGVRLSSGYAGLMPASVLDPADELTARLGGVSWRFVDHAWTRVPDPLPRARLLSTVRVSRDVPSDIRAIDVVSTALVGAPIAPTGGGPGEAHLTVDRPGRIVVHTAAPDTQLLLLTERFHEGWIADISGQAAAPIRVNGDFLGCVVPAGTHDVTLVFAPSSVRRGAALTVAGLILTIGAALVIARVRS